MVIKAIIYKLEGLFYRTTYNYRRLTQAQKHRIIKLSIAIISIIAISISIYNARVEKFNKEIREKQMIVENLQRMEIGYIDNVLEYRKMENVRSEEEKREKDKLKGIINTTVDKYFKYKEENKIFFEEGYPLFIKDSLYYVQ